MNENTNITPNFKFYEFYSNSITGVKIRPPDGYVPNIIEVARQLQQLRDIVCQPIRINSGYRTKEWNLHVGGASSSQHLSAKAVDISVSNISIQKLLFYIGRYTDFKGIGIARTFVHVDIRDSEEPVIWYY